MNRSVLVGVLASALLPASLASAGSVAAGARHTLVRSSDGRVFAWGDNSRGQLGAAAARGSAVPIVVEDLADVAAVSAGADHSLAVTAEGSVFAWGANESGQLGDGTLQDRDRPVRVAGLPGIVAVAAGGAHSLALDGQGRLWAWGRNDSGQLGEGSESVRSRPAPIDMEPVRVIAAGARHSLAATASGRVWEWGGGRGLTRTLVQGLPAVIAVSAGADASLGLTSEGNVFGWGSPTPSATTANRPSTPDLPQPIAALANVIAISAGARHALAVTSDGNLYAWGASERGQLGVGSETHARPVHVSRLSTIEIAAASSGAHSVAITADGIVWAWGANEGGQVGDGTRDDREFPVQITEPGYACLVGTPVFRPAGGSSDGPVRVSVSCATPGAAIHYTLDGADPTLSDPMLDAAELQIDRTTTLRARAFRYGMPASNVAVATYRIATGADDAGRAAGHLAPEQQPGAPQRALRGGSPPAPLVFTPGVAAAGLRHSLILKPDGTVWAFGLNSSGQLGDGTTTDRRYPVQVGGLNGVTVVAIAAGAYHSLALDSAGNVWAWGLNNSGQVGVGNTNPVLTPAQVLSNAVAIAAGTTHTLAARTDGTAWAWGTNANGQLGDGTTAQRTSPTQVGGGFTGAVKVAGAYRHSVALRSDGTVWAWGANDQGQLGDGTTTQQLLPVRVDGATSISEVVTGRSDLAFGATTSIARRDDGAVLGWGYNNNGQIGDGTTLQRLTAVPALISNVAAVAAGESHTLAIKNDGGLWAWGSNGSGELGDGTTTQRLSPVTIPAPTSVVAVAAGGAHSLAVTEDGSVYAWGYNATGQLGDGTTTNRSAPRQIAEPGFAWKVGTPVLVPAGGTYGTEQTVTVTVATPGATIHYTTSGAEPTESDPVVASGGTVSVSQDLTLKVKAWRTGWAASHTASEAYALKPAMPAASPGGGSYTTTLNVTLTTTTSGATIRYTIDGSEPTESSTTYTVPVYVGSTLTLKAKAFKSGWTPSDTRTATYTLNLGPLTPPQISPAAGTYIDGVEVTMSGPVGATIRYTTDGSEPTANSTVYSGAFTLDVTATVKAKAFDPSHSASATTAVAYTIQVSPPILTPAGGTYAIGQVVTASGVAGATLRYTVNGGDPTASDAVFPSSGVTPVAAATLKVKAFRAGCSASSTTTGAYTITGTPAAMGMAAGRDAGLGYHGVAHNAAGGAWSWGYNSVGQLGDGSQIQRPTPVLVSTLASVVAVSAGTSHTLFLKSNGQVWGAGANNLGQLGDATTTSPRTTPVQVSTATGMAGVTAITAGGDHALAVGVGGTLWSWGSDASGQLGDGTAGGTRSQPYQVTVPNETITVVAAGASHSLALTANQTVYAWGLNSSGQLGNGNWTNQASPVLVSALTGVVAIAAGNNHSLAITANGTLYAWGLNSNGQLGNGTTTSSNVPVQVINISGVRSVAGTGWHSVASRVDGTVFAWGLNSAGQLGDGTTSQHTTPGIVPGLAGIARAAAGGASSFAMDKDARAWGWGENDYNQLGDGTTINRLTPVLLSQPSTEWQVATPTTNPRGGAFTAAVNVIVACATSGAEIHYTTNGVDPTTNDPTVVSGGVVNVAASLTLKVKAFKTGMPASNVAAETYTLTVPAPAASPGGGTYNVDKTVTLSTPPAGATIRYTTDGSAPTPSSPVYTGAIAVERTLTIKAKAWRPGWQDSAEMFPATYTMKVGTPAFSPPAGAYGAAQTVTVTTVTAGATLHYTTSGLEPTESDPVVASGSTVTIDRSTTLRVKGWKPDWTASDTGIATYALSLGTVATPTFTPAPGTYPAAQLVAMATATPGAVIRFTTDGSEPTFTSRVYYAPIAVDWTTTLKAKAFKPELAPSATGTATYTIEPADTAAPAAFSPAPGTYPTTQTVTLTTATAGALIHYTTNGAVPGESDPSVSSGGTVAVDRPMSLKARVFKSGLAPSPTRRADYFITGAVAAAMQHGAALKVDKTLWTWGVNGTGQVGNGTTATVTAPVQVLTDVRGTSMAGDVYGGQTLAVKWDGTLWGWGRNQYGMLCNGSTSQSTSPIQAGAATHWVAVSAGGSHTLILKNDGTVWSCGANGNGQLGNGTTTNSTTPVAVSGLTDVVAIAAGTSHSMALKRDGTTWTWGYNYYGQLGDGTTTQRTSPVQVSALRGVIAVSAGGHHSAALRSEGATTSELWTWGYNNAGQVGDGTTGANRTSPIRGPAGPRMVSASSQATLFTAVDVTARGSVWGSGNHNGDYLTPGSQPSSTRPVRIGEGDFVSVAAGDNFSLALTRDTTVVSWGPNSYAAANGLVLGTAGGADDPDGDGLSTATEWMLGTDPWNADTNGDGISDGMAVASGRSPLDPDMDGDGLFNAAEILNGTDPFNADTDGDAVSDGTDCFPLDPTRSTCPPPTPGDSTPPVITLTEPTNATLISSIPPQ